MNAQHPKIYRYRSSGFSLLEVLVTIAILTVLVLIVMAFTGDARKKAVDASTKKVLSSVRTVAAQDYAGQYANTFTVGSAAQTQLDKLALSLGYTTADNGTAYQYIADTNGFVAIFPLKVAPTKYWCVDAEGASRGTNGLLATTGPKTCGNATRDPSAVPNMISLMNFNIDLQTTGPITYTQSSLGATLKVWAFSGNSTIQKVEYYRDTTLLNIVSGNVNPNTLYWDTIQTPSGTYSVTAKATDAAGNTKTSSPITVIIDNSH